MTEDELLIGVSEALTLAGWRWFHIRRSDEAIVQGDQGWPDLFAIHPTRGALALELKDMTRQATPDQLAWIHSLTAAGIPTAIIRPDRYDWILDVILGRVPIAPRDNRPPELPPGDPRLLGNL